MALTAGMDIESVRSISAALKHDASALAGVISAVDALIAEAEGSWSGKDADKFKTDWTGTHKPQLTKVQQAVDTLGTQASTNATQQEQTSNA